MRTELWSLEFILRKCQCAVVCLVQLDHWELYLKPGPWAAFKALQGYSVFLGRFKLEQCWSLPSDTHSGKVGGGARRELVWFLCPKVKSYPHWNTAQLCPLSQSSTWALKMQMKSHLAQLRTIQCFLMLFESNPISLFQSPILFGSCLFF